MGALPRENYVPEAARAFAYFDRPLKVGGTRAMMPPAAIGRLLSELAPRPGERALVVGAATGYSAALLKQIGLDVTATEDDAALAATARALGIDIAASDDGASYDLILVDGAVDYIPDELVGRLVEGGRLGTALLDRGVSRLVVGRAASGRLGLRTIVDADVAPLPGFERPRAFTF
jgi:protein-L-isoaspartate(D-aspartate) O-methyltransferase